MDASSEALITLLLFVGLFLHWIKAVISAAVAVLIRNRIASVGLVLMVGAVEGLVGPRLELLDLYLTRTGWETIDTLTLITIVLSALASVLWWLIARALYALVRRLRGADDLR
jgi:ABC-type microcin C transport system permease subunit YejE